MPVRILISDDHAVVRSGLRALLRSDPGLEVVGEAGDGVETLRLAETLRPDVILLDITMPPENGIKIAKRLKETHPEIKVLFLTMHEEEGLLQEALDAGAAGYVVKRAEEAEIIQAIHSASQGDIYIHPAMTRALLHQPVPAGHRRGPPAKPPVNPLTRRELDVLRLLAKGNTNRQIAVLLGLSKRTVENHRANLMGKLGLVSRVELVSYAEEHNLL
jgi:two-component system response regulator NreC